MRLGERTYHPDHHLHIQYVVHEHMLCSGASQLVHEQ